MSPPRIFSRLGCPNIFKKYQNFKNSIFIMMGLTGAFSNLGINETKNENSPKKPNFPRSSSANNILITERPQISPKFIRKVEDLEMSEQPVDFSKKYSETKLENPETCSSKFNSVVKTYNSSFTIYAETDLDQPTDYSLRYAEDDTDSDCCKIQKPETTEFVQDTIKTYCTEDTPYETPFNFSTSTSLTDLRIDDKKIDETDSAKNENITVINTKENKIIKSEFSSGLMSPEEKPVNYCEEGTPGYFSRVPSCGSLNSELPVVDPPKQELKEEEHVEKTQFRKIKFDREAKNVKFEEVVNYAEETPLMFSRSSSLASLDSIEQHSIHDDRSSCVSDFSRLTSGVISPSELPDSPSQTVPPSPKPRKTSIVFPASSSKKSEEPPKTPHPVQKSSVFEDSVKKFKIESTPILFSSATSLSSLTDGEIDAKAHKNDSEIETKNQNLDLSENSEEEDILAACINIGMQSNRYRQSNISSPKSPVKNTTQILSLPKNVPKISEDSVETRKTDVTSDSLRTYCTEGTPAVLSHAGSNSNLSILSLQINEKLNLSGDTFTNEKEELLTKIVDDRTGYGEQEDQNVPSCNFDLNATCINRSHRSSFSSLSDDSHESEEALLEKCILAGMPKSSIPSTSLASTSHKIDGKDLDETLEIIETDVSDEDGDILEKCIKIGIENNKYTQKTSALQEVHENDTVRNYCTEDTPAILSHAGSCSNLSNLLENDSENFLSDINSNSSEDEDEERLLAECVEYGMAAISKKGKAENTTENLNRSRRKQKHPSKNKLHEISASNSSLSDDSSYEADQALLQQCIQAGMPKRKPKYEEDSSELTSAEKALLQQCILDGMKKCQTATKKTTGDDSAELTEVEQALLRQCLLDGMPKNKNLAIGGPSRESAELSESERILLHQCFMAGLPKNRKTKEVSGRKPRETAHTCCIHCPKNKSKRGHSRNRRKYRERVQVRETREVNILYVTSQILTMKKEVDRQHEKWV